MKSVKELQNGDNIVYRDELYRILRKEVIAVGTHSHSKLRIEVQGVFSGVAEVVNFAPHSIVEDVEIIRKKGQVIAKQRESLQVMDMVSYETLNAAANEGLRQQLQEGDEVTFVEFKGAARVLEKR